MRLSLSDKHGQTSAPPPLSRLEAAQACLLLSFTFPHHGRPRFVRAQTRLYALLFSLCCRLLPKPVYAPSASDDEDDEVVQPVAQSSAQASQSVVLRNVVPPYGQRAGWRPSSLEDYGALTSMCAGLYSQALYR